MADLFRRRAEVFVCSATSRNAASAIKRDEIIFTTLRKEN
jgi:hypothetical protein